MFSHAQRPVAAAVFTLIGGAAMFRVGAHMLNMGMAVGLLMWVLALLLLFYPQAHTALGVSIMVLSVISFAGSQGGLIAGDVLGVAGGALAVAWQSRPEKFVELTEEEAKVVRGELAVRGRSLPGAWVLWLFTGLGGGHRYYLGHYWRAGLMSLFFAVMFISSLVKWVLVFWWLVDAFLVPMAVRDANFRLGINALYRMYTEDPVVETGRDEIESTF
jgi:hypothetical protein